MTVHGVVFDFDGLILDTEGPVFTAWCEEFEAHGCGPLTVDEWAFEIGTSGALDLVSMLRSRATSPFDETAMHARRRRRRDELLALEAARPGVVTWLDELAARGLPVAVASSSPSTWVEPLLDRIGLRDRFAFLACCDGELAGKPAPDTYLAACEAIAVAPSDALAIEDSPHGVAAAKAAGCACVAVPHALTASLDLTSADLVVGSLADVALGDVLERLG